MLELLDTIDKVFIVRSDESVEGKVAALRVVCQQAVKVIGIAA